MKNLLYSLIVLLIFPATITFAQTGKSSTRALFDKKTVGEIRLTLPITNWSDALDSMRIYGMGMLGGTAVVDGVTYEGAGVRFRGDKSYQLGLKRNPFTIQLNHTNAEANHQGYTQIKLSSALRDPSMVREMLFLEVAGKYMPAPQASYTKLYINEEYVGVFINVENIDRNFLKKHYGGAGGNALFKAGVDYKPNIPTSCKQNIYGSLEYEDNLECYKGNFELHSEYEGWSELQEFTRILTQDPKNIERHLDVDNALWMLALNNVMVNLSSYSGNHSINYYLYRDNNGRFQPILWDLNLAFGSFKNTGDGSDLDLKGLQNLDPLLHAENSYKPLISQLLKNDLYRKTYLAHIRQILEENFHNGLYEKRAQELQALIVVYFNDDKNKVYSMDDFKNSLNSTIGKRSKIPGITELMSKRGRFLKAHPDLTALPSLVSDVNVQGRGKFENQRLNTFRISAKADRFPKRMLLHYRFSDDSPYMILPMTEEVASDLSAGVKQFSANIEAKNEDDTLQYFIQVENAGSVSFQPAQYMRAPLKVKLSDLNK